MKVFVFSIITLFTVSTYAQTTLTGYVTLQNSGGKSAFPAQVSTYGATDTDVDKDKGYFRLIFDRKRPGQDVQLEVARDGYEVVNKRSLAHRLPEAHEVQRPLKLHLCPKGQWQRYAAEYEGINLKAIERSHEEKLVELQRQLESKSIEVSDYRRIAFQLAEEKKIAEAQTQELAEKFAKANLDEATGRFVLAHRLFTEGKTDSVLIVLDEEKMKADLEAADKDIREGKELITIGEGKVLNGTEAREKILEEFMVKARTHIIKSEWANAEYAFEVAVHADSSHTDNWFEYALFLQEQNQYTRAQPIYEHCLSLQKTAPDVANTLHNLGNLYLAKNDLQQAEKCYLRVLEIRERLANKNPLVYKPDVATTLHNLANLYHAKNDFPLAKKNFLRALEIQERLANKNPQTYGPDLAMTLISLGVLYKAKNDFLKAEKSFLHALEIYERFVNEKPWVYEPEMAITLISLGILYLAKNDFPLAKKNLLQALEITERLTEENPRSYEPYLAIILHKLGILYQDKKNYLRALEITERLAEENPHSYEPYVTKILHSLGDLYSARNDLQQAERSYLHALKIRERLAQENPRAMNIDLCWTYLSLSRYCLARLKSSKGENKWREQGMEWLEKVNETLAIYPENFEPRVQLSIDILNVANELQNYDENKAAWQPTKNKSVIKKQ